jgi:hypothetical protein
LTVSVQEQDALGWELTLTLYVLELPGESSVGHATMFLPKLHMVQYILRDTCEVVSQVAGVLGLGGSVGIDWPAYCGKYYPSPLASLLWMVMDCA